jgi:hypothetical protein
MSVTVLLFLGTIRRRFLAGCVLAYQIVHVEWAWIVRERRDTGGDLVVR